jgi:hypothetical protein
MADPRRLAQVQRLLSTELVENPLYQCRDNQPYGMDLIEYAHKFKFLFAVQFNFSEGYEFVGGRNKFALLAQTCDLPNPVFEFEEVNLYGARTTVTKRTTFNPVTMTFLDDNQNEMMRFYTNALRALSPITNVTQTSAVYTGQYNFQMNQAIGNDGRNSIVATRPHLYPVSSGPLFINDRKPSPTNLLTSINIYHIYSYGRAYNKYTLHTPRIEKFELPQLDMTDSGTVSALTLGLKYTSFDVELEQPMTGHVSSLVGDTMYRVRRDLS